MEIFERNESRPIYLWIRKYGSINNIPRGIKGDEYYGYEIIRDVMPRFFNMYKVNCANIHLIFGKAITKYNSTWQAIHQRYDWFHLKCSPKKRLSLDDIDLYKINRKKFLRVGLHDLEL